MTEDTRKEPKAVGGALQLSLPIEYAPAVIREHGYQAAHSYPLVGRRRGPHDFVSWRTDPPRAWPEGYIELRAGHAWTVINLDCDDPEALRAADEQGLPWANWRVRNPANGHEHRCYALASPVARFPHANVRPLEYLARVADWLHERTGADPGYSGALACNPTSPPPGRVTEWGRREPYALGELADWIRAPYRRPTSPVSVIGRNCALFGGLMRWAGRWANRDGSLVLHAAVLNDFPAGPLDLAEVNATVRSVEGYRAEWLARGWHRPAWVERQRKRGRNGGVRSGRVRAARARLRARTARAMRAEGSTQAEIAAALECSQQAVSGYLRKSADDLTIEANTDNVPETGV